MTNTPATGLRPGNTTAEVLDAEVKKLRRQVETLKEGWRIADEGRIEAEAERDAMRAEAARIADDYHPQRGQEALALAEMREAISTLAQPR